MLSPLRKTSERDLILLLALVAFAVTVAFFTLAVLPRINAYRALFKTETTLTQIVKSEGTLDTQLADLSGDITALQKRLQGDMAALPEKEIEAYVVGSLQRLSWKNKVQLISIEPSAGHTIESFHELLFQVKLEGGYFDMYRWLQETSGELGFVLIKQYEMKSIDTSTQNPRLSVTLTMATYRASK